MTYSVSEVANLISRALISSSKRSGPTRTWTPSMEQTLHRLGCRESLTPSLVALVIDPFLLHHQRLALGFFNWASQQPGFSHSSITYRAMLKSLSISRHFNAVDKVLKQVRTEKIHLDSSVYRSIIESQIIGRKTQNAFSIFNEASSLNCDVGQDTCNSLLAALSSGGYSGHARKMFDEMIQRGVSLTTLGFGVFIWRLCRIVDVLEILSLLDEVIENGVWGINGSIIAVLIVHGLCLESRVGDAFWILDELRKRDCKPDFIAYRVVAEAFRLMGNVVHVEMVLKKKRKLGVAPRTNDYREFLFVLISERQIGEAKELGEIIVSGNFPIEDDLLNALIGSVSISYPCSAMLFFKFMVAKNRFPTLLTLSNLSRNLCKHRKFDELLEVFQILSTKEYFLDMRSYDLMVSFLCKAGWVKEAYEVLHVMKKKGLCPDVSFYNYVLEACCRRDLLRPARRLWDEMFASGCGGNLKTYNILIRKFSETGQVEEAQRLFSRMLEKKVVPDAMTYTSLLEGLCKEKQLQDAFEIFNKAVEQDVLVAKSILNPFILCLCKGSHFHAASGLLCGLTAGIGDSDSHVVLLKCLIGAREIPLSIEHMKWVRENSAVMLQTMCTELLALDSPLSKSEFTLQLVQAVQDNI